MKHKIQATGAVTSCISSTCNKRWIESGFDLLGFKEFFFLIVPPSQAHSRNISILAGRRCGLGQRRVPIACRRSLDAHSDAPEPSANFFWVASHHAVTSREETSSFGALSVAR